MSLRGLDIEGGDTAASNAAYRHDGVEHSGGIIVGGVTRGSSDLKHAFTARHRLADIGAMADMAGAGSAILGMDDNSGGGEGMPAAPAAVRRAGAAIQVPTTSRRASSILKPLCPDGLASASAASAARANA